MSLSKSQPWEVQLLLIAQEALNSQRLHENVQADQGMVAAAYRYCEAMTREHSKTFYVASSMLPRDKRLAARALYAFCRITDDIVDDPNRSVEERQAALMQWQSDIMSDHLLKESPVCLAWADSQAKFNIPRGYAQQLIDGCAQDIDKTRYATFNELAEYSYGVASTVGLMAMHIVGFVGEEALPYAIRLGVALQLTNILRDVAEDWRNGRLYLPQDELAQFGLSEADIERGIVDDRWRNFMRFQIERNRTLYAESINGIAALDQDGRLAIAAAAELYCAILEDIEAHDYDVFSRRAYLSMPAKMSRMPGIWIRSRRATLD